MKNVYMVRKENRASLTYNKRDALRVAKEFGCQVWKTSYQYYRDCNFSMDMPTFMVVGELIYDYPV